MTATALKPTIDNKPTTTGRITKQVRPSDLERLPDPSLTAREYTPEEIVGAQRWAELPDDQKRQLALELDDWLSGMYRTRAHNEKAVRRGEATDLRPVRILLAGWATTLAGIIEQDREKYAPKSPKGGKRPEWFHACQGIPAESLARVTLDALFTAIFDIGRDGERKPTVANVCVRLGREADVLRRVQKWIKANPKLYRSYLKRLGHAGATKKHRRKVLLHGINQKLIPALQEEADKQELQAWDTIYSARVGKGLLLLAASALGGRLKIGSLTKAFKRGRPRSPTNTIELDAETREWIAQALRAGEIESRRMRPMVCKPLSWAGPWGGGYLLGTLTNRSVMFGGSGPGKRTWELLKEHRKVAHRVYSALNYLGSSALRVRRSVLAIAIEARDAGITLPELPTKGRRVPIPMRPPDIETNDKARKEYRIARARAEEANLKAMSKELANEDALAEAWALRDEPTLYFPHSCDFRGRMYPLPTGLQAQGSDLRRALLEFSAGKPISGDDASAGWLAIQVAKTFGQDKLSYDERIAWVFENEDLIRTIADDPLGNRQLWEAQADRKKLWQCLAACIEWRDYLEHGEGFVSHLPVYVDGTCNGIQHFTALSGDADLARLVNLVPGERPEDIYADVAEGALRSVRRALQEAGPERVYAKAWLDLLNGFPARKLAKTMVMIDPYGGTFKAVMDDVRKTLAQLDPHHAVIPEEDAPKAVGFMATCLRDSLAARLAWPNAVKNWLKACVEAVHKWGLSGDDVKPGVQWFAPSGWPWGLMYGEEAVTKIKANRGDTSLTTRYHSLSDRKVSLTKQRSACPPNFVHALDASAMVFALNLLRWHSEVSGVIAIHDSIGALAADMPVVDTAVREGFVKLYTEHEPLRSFQDAILEQVRPDCRHLVPSPPEPGELDVREVLSSAYFFS